MPIEFVLSLQDALARLPDAQRPSQDQLEMFASSFLIPLEYEKLNSLCCPRCGSNTWDQVSRGSVGPKVGLDWPYACPGGDEHNCRCKQCGYSLVVRFWFTKQAQPSRSEQEQTRHTTQTDFKDADSSSGNELTQYLGNMLRELRASQLTTTTSDSRVKRMEDFLIEFAQFVLNGGTDNESHRLEGEIAWLKTNNASLPWPAAPLPPTVFKTFTTLLRSHTPRYQKMTTDFMEAYVVFITSGQGDKKKLIQQIESLSRAGLLPDHEATKFYSTLTPSKAARELERMFLPWWKRIFR